MYNKIINGINRWILSINYKNTGTLYIFFAGFSGIIGILLSVLKNYINNNKNQIKNLILILIFILFFFYHNLYNSILLLANELDNNNNIVSANIASSGFRQDPIAQEFITVNETVILNDSNQSGMIGTSTYDLNLHLNAISLHQNRYITEVLLDGFSSNMEEMDQNEYLNNDIELFVETSFLPAQQVIDDFEIPTPTICWNFNFRYFFINILNHFIGFRFGIINYFCNSNLCRLERSMSILEEDNRYNTLLTNYINQIEYIFINIFNLRHNENGELQVVETVDIPTRNISPSHVVNFLTDNLDYSHRLRNGDYRIFFFNYNNIYNSFYNNRVFFVRTHYHLFNINVPRDWDNRNRDFSPLYNNKLNDDLFKKGLENRHYLRVRLFDSLNNHYIFLKNNSNSNLNNKKQIIILLKSENKDLNNIKIDLNTYYTNFYQNLKTKKRSFMEIKFDIQYIIEEKEKQINKYVYDNSHI
jgi:hypothetical protein